MNEDSTGTTGTSSTEGHAGTCGASRVSLLQQKNEN